MDSPTGEKSIWQRENPTDTRVRGHGTVATVGVVATPAPTPNVTVLPESVPAEKWQWGMLVSCSL